MILVKWNYGFDNIYYQADSNTEFSFVGKLRRAKLGLDVSGGFFYVGVYLDSKALEDGLFQAVVQYKIDNGKVLAMLPKANYELDIKRIRELPAPPRFVYGEQVSPCNHSDMTGVIVGIHWHFKRNCCFYTISINEKTKSKRYFDDDLISAV